MNTDAPLAGRIQTSCHLAVKVLRVVLAAESLLLVAIVFVSALRRLHYPFSLDWVEEGTLTGVGRMAQHLPLYVAPTVHYTPYIYAPLFFWLSAQVARVVGVGYPAMRLVSILSMFGLFAAVFAFVLGEARSRSRVLSALVGVGLFGTAYAITDGFPDVGRVDSLSLFLTMLGLMFVRRGRLVLGALLFAIAMQTKQGMLPIAVLALCSEWQQRKRLLLGLASLAVFCVAPVAWLTRASGGWYWLYVFKVAPGFHVDTRTMEWFLVRDVVPMAGLSLVLIVAGVVLAPPRQLGRAGSFYILTGIGMVLYTGYVRAHAGAAGNANIPAFLWIALTAAICFERLHRRLSEAPDAAWAAGGLVVLVAVPILQMAVYAYGPAYWTPNRVERQQREALIAELRKLPGDVWVVDHPQYGAAAGKPVYADGKAVDGLITSPGLPYGAELKASFAALIHERNFSAVVLEGSLDTALADDRLPQDFSEYYPVRADIKAVSDAISASADKRSLTEPTWAFLPCPSASVPDPRMFWPGVPVDMSRCQADLPVKSK